MAAAATAKKSIEEESYDDIPYESYAYVQTHPDRLFTIAKLFQMDAAPIDKCRILELGCAMGGNIAPLAMKYPDSYALGVDISGEQIKEANELKAYLGLKNIDFQQADISKLDENIGEFDYIICHGVFSWVPDAVRDAVFEVCQKHLSDRGLAVISFNTLPGWGAVKTLRDMMLFHSKNFEKPEDKVREARALLGFIKENSSQNSAYNSVIEKELEILSTTNDSYVFHEHLESENHQYYLTDFVDMAKTYDLAYVGDTDITSMYAGNFSANARQTLSQIKDIVQQEQYMDFLQNRRFRHTILTKAENAKNINRAMQPQAILDFYLMANFTADNDGKLGTDGKAHFTHYQHKAQKFSTNDRISSLSLIALSKHRKPIKAETIAKEVSKEHGVSEKDVMTALVKNTLLLALQNFLTLSTDTYDYYEEVSDKPRAYAITLYQTQKTNSVKITNKRLGAINSDRVSRVILSMLDGKNTLDDIAEKLADMSEKGEIGIKISDKPLAKTKESMDIFKGELKKIIQQYADNAFLEA